MKLLHTIQSLSPSEAGLFFFLNDLTRWQRSHNCDITVVGLNTKMVNSDQLKWNHVRTETVQPRGPRFFPFAAGLQQILSKIKPDIIHCHGLWTFPSLVIPRYCRKNNIPFLVSPHGMLEPWAWRHNAWKKRPVWWLWERRFLRQASALHATANQEAQNLSGLGLCNPMAIVPVGVGIPSQPFVCKKHFNKTKTALFISRIHPKKGLLNLVKAWNIVRPTGWKVIIAGPDSDGHQALVQKAVRDAGLSEQFEFPGPVYDAAKTDLYQSADLFILPTYCENFGIVIAEALAAGKPVITTRETPWKDLIDHRCGWWIEVGEKPLAIALREAVSLSDLQRKVMGFRGKKLVTKKYSWNHNVRKMLHVYGWILGHEKKPDYVL